MSAAKHAPGPWSCIVEGDYAQMKAAACRLRTLYLKAERKVVDSRVEQLMTGGVL